MSRSKGASNCVERHLNLNGRDTSLIWTYSQVGRRCCFQSTTGTPGAPRSRVVTLAYSAGDNSKIVTRGSTGSQFTGSQFTTMKQEKENVGSKGSESGKPRRHIGP